MTPLGVIEITMSDFFCTRSNKKSPKLLKKSQIAKESWLCICDCNQFIATESYFFNLPFRLSTYTLGQKPFWRSIFQTHPFLQLLCWIGIYAVKTSHWKTDGQKWECSFKKDFIASWTKTCNADIFCSSYFERFAFMPLLIGHRSQIFWSIPIFLFVSDESQYNAINSIWNNPIWKDFLLGTYLT